MAERLDNILYVFFTSLEKYCAQVFEMGKRAMVTDFYRGTIKFGHNTTGQMLVGIPVD